MKRGEIYSVAAPGEFNKPRPAVIIQTNALTEQELSSVIVCPFTSTISDAPLFRILIEPNSENGLTKASQIMVDKIKAISVQRIGVPIGSINDEQIVQLNRTLAFVVGLG